MSTRKLEERGQRGQGAKEEISRVPAPLNTVLLDDIARGIQCILEKMSDQVPDGVTDQVTVAVAGPTSVAMQPTESDPPWFYATVFNDGPSPVFVSLNEPLSNPTESKAALNMGDSMVINTVEAKIKSLWFSNMNATDTSSVRVQLLQ